MEVQLLLLTTLQILQPRKVLQRLALRPSGLRLVGDWAVSFDENIPFILEWTILIKKRTQTVVGVSSQ